MSDEHPVHNHGYDPGCKEIDLGTGPLGECLFIGRAGVTDPVNSPEHYRWLPVEVIEITEKFSFTLGNVLKYVMRADHKGRPLEDLKKARWYLDREIAHRERLASEDSR